MLGVLSEHEHSTVWLAEHRQLGAKRIIKGIPKSSQFYLTLSKEAHILKNLSHPNIPIIYDLEEDDEFTYIVEEYIEGESLGSLIKSRPLSVTEIIHYSINISTVISYLHSLSNPVCYLDLKPENIIVSKGEVYLIDFGSSVYVSESMDGTLFGTVRYSAPELKRGNRPSPASDVYSIGRLMLFMLEHSKADSLKEHKRKSLLIGISERCCEKRWYRRISRAEILIKMLRELEKKENNQLIKTEISTPRVCIKIGIKGLHRGCGATHLAISLANYLVEDKGKRVCLSESESKHDIEELRQGLRIDCINQDGVFEYKGVTYVPGRCKSRGIAWLGQDFDCVIYDISHEDCSIEQYCDLILYVDYFAPWHSVSRPELRGLGFLIINLADNKSLQKIKNQGLPMMAYPYSPDCFNLDEEAILVFRKLTDRFWKNQH